MKLFNFSLPLIFALALIGGCTGNKAVNQEPQAAIDTVSVSDTGYTGIKQYVSGKKMFKEITFNNGVRQGLMKTFYQSGEVRQTFWYENGLREDSSIWYYLEGQKFRSTPYRR